MHNIIKHLNLVEMFSLQKYIYHHFSFLNYNPGEFTNIEMSELNLNSKFQAVSLNSFSFWSLW